MHLPDHLLSPEAAIVTGGVAAGAVTYALLTRSARLPSPGIPVVAGTAAVVFAAQMVNYPVTLGTSGHLMGAVLAVSLVGARLGLLVITSVLAVQAVVFGDGGITALGANVLFMGVIPVLVACLASRILRKISIRVGPRVVVALAALLSVPVSALAFSAAYGVSGSGTTDIASLTAAMVSVHLLVGIGEAGITVIVLSVVMWAAPGAAAWDRRAARPTTAGRAALVLAGIAGVCAVVLAAVASGLPDGLESVVFAYQLPQGDAVHAGISFLANYGESSGAPVALIGVVGCVLVSLIVVALERLRAGLTAGLPL